MYDIFNTHYSSARTYVLSAKGFMRVFPNITEQVIIKEL